MTLADTVDWLADAVRRRVRATEWIGLGALGVIAFVAGYAAVAALTFVGTPPTEGVGITGALLTIGFTFYSAHQVPLDVVGGGRIDFIGRFAGSDVPAAAYYAVPILVLLGVGAYTKWQFGRGEFDPFGWFLNVVGVGVGYVLMAVLGTFVFLTSTDAGDPVRLPLGLTILLASLYVFAFGVLGAALASVLDSWRRVR